MIDWRHHPLYTAAQVGVKLHVWHTGKGYQVNIADAVYPNSWVVATDEDFDKAMRTALAQHDSARMQRIPDFSKPPAGVPLAKIPSATAAPVEYDIDDEIAGMPDDPDLEDIL